MSATKLKKELLQMSQEQVVELVLDLYTKVPKAKEYFDIFLSFDIEKLAEKYRKQIRNYILPNSQYVTREAEARKIIREIRKMNLEELTVELELYYAECTMKLINEYGDFTTTNIVDYLEKTLFSAEQTIKKRKWENSFEERIQKLKSDGNKYGIFS